MRFRIHKICTVLLLLLNCCCPSPSEETKSEENDTLLLATQPTTPSVTPLDAKILDKVNFYGGDSIVLYLTHENDSLNICSIWKYKSKDGTRKRILTTVDKAYTYDIYTRIWPKDSIDVCIYDAKILDWNDGHFKIMVEGAYPYTTYKLNYLVTEASDSATLLPSTWGYLGLTHDYDHIIAQSFKYYSDGGTYSIIDIYDLDGNLVKSIPLNTRPIIPSELYHTFEDEDWFENWGVTLTDIEELVEENPSASAKQLIKIARKRFAK